MSLVSVIIPSFNSGKLVVEAVQSVLEQTYEDVEVVVVDDGSTDDTRERLAVFRKDGRIRVVSHQDGKNHGVCASRRLALDVVEGEFVAFLDADDRYLPTKLEKHVAILQASPEVGLLHGAVSIFSIEQNAMLSRNWWAMEGIVGIYDVRDTRDYLVHNRIVNSTVVCRRNHVASGMLPQNMVFQFEDWFLWTVIACHSSFYYDPEPLTIYQYHADSFTWKQRQRPGGHELAGLEFMFSLLPHIEDRKTRSRIHDRVFESLLRLQEVRVGEEASASASAGAGRLQREFIGRLLVRAARRWASHSIQKLIPSGS